MKSFKWQPKKASYQMIVMPVMRLDLWRKSWPALLAMHKTIRRIKES